ncbi:MAG: response regulator transcription factor [Candidatus Latescibacterota bacterium]
MIQKTILAVDDEQDILELLEYNLSKEGYKVLTAESGESALDIIRKNMPDLIVLDLMLPGMDGLEICRVAKENPQTKHIPIVMLTAKGEEADIVAGLEIGAEDYITKPFSPRVLLARIRAVLRRKSQPAAGTNDVIRIHGIEIDPGRRTVLVKNKALDLTYTEFNILLFLARRPGWVFTRCQIVESVHGEEYPVTDRSVDVQIVGLRKKLGAAGKYIDTVRGVGYRFKET